MRARRDTLVRIATEVCTQKELQALIYHLEDKSDRQIALILNINRSSVRDRLANATRKIIHHPDYPDTEQAL